MIPTGSIESYLMNQIFGGGGKGKPSVSHSYSTQSGYTPQRNDLVEIHPSTGAASKTVTKFESGQIDFTKVADTNVPYLVYSMMFSDNKGVLSYYNSGLYVAYFEIVGASINISTPLVFSGYTEHYGYGGKDIIMINSTQFVVLVGTMDSSRDLKALLFNYSGSGISYVSTTTIYSNNSVYVNYIKASLISPDKLLVTYAVSGVMYARVITRNGATFEINTHTMLQTGSSSVAFIYDLYKVNNTTHVYIGKRESTNTTYGRLVIDGSTNLVSQTNVTYKSITDSSSGVTTALVNDNKVLVVGLGHVVYAYVLDIVTLSAGTVYNLLDTGINGSNIIASYDPAYPSRIALISSIGTSRRAAIISVTGLVPALVGSMSSLTSSLGYASSVNNFLGSAAPSKLMNFVRTGSSNPYSLHFEFYSVKGDEISGGMTQIPNPMGIVKSSGSGQVQAALNHSVVDGFAGLTIGTKYYCSDSGNLTTTATRQPIGVAISATEIFFYGLTSLGAFPIAYKGQITRTHTVSGTATPGRVVKLNTNNTISNYNGSGVIYGVYQGSGVVVLSGVVKGLSGLNMSKQYYFDNSGVIGEMDMGDGSLAGTPISASELMTTGFILSNNKERL